MLRLIWPLFLFICITSFGEELLNIKLTHEEEEWVKFAREREINIYLDRDRGILNYCTESGDRGIFPYMIEVLEKNTGLNFRVVEEDKESFEESVDLGIPHIVFGVEDYKRNSENYYYLEKPVKLNGIFITRKDYPIIDSGTGISNRTIVCVEEDQIKDKIISKYGEKVKIILRPSIEEATKSILSGEADIYVEDLQDGLKYLVENPELNIKINYFSQSLKTSYYIGGKPQYRPLINIIGKIFSGVDINKELIYDKALDYTKNKLEISEEVRSYIKNNRTLKVYLPEVKNLSPLYYIDKSGNENGFLVNYFYEIERILGVKVVLEKGNSPQGYHINPFIVTVNNKELRNENFFTTAPYYEFQFLIFNRENSGYISDSIDLNKYKVAVAKGSIAEDYLLNRGLKSNLVILPSNEDVIKSVSSGGADLFIGNIKGTDGLLKKYKIKNIKVAGIIQDKISLKIGVPKEEKILFFIINSFERDFSYGIEQRKKEMLEKNITLSRDYKFSILIALISATGFWGVYIHLKRVKRIHSKIRNLTIGLVETLENANSYNDEDTGFHVRRINKYSQLISSKLGMNNTFVQEIGLFASLHDIGKIGIPDSILKKPGKLTIEEFEIMKNHTEIGFNIIKGLDVGSVALNIIRYHHERWDGGGYGKSLKGEEIPIEARIVALADVYDALRQERVYKKPFSHEKACEVITSESGKHFDPQLVEVFLENHEYFKEIFENIGAKR